jgi:hypothetical protein
VVVESYKDDIAKVKRRRMNEQDEREDERMSMMKRCGFQHDETLWFPA